MSWNEALERLVHEFGFTPETIYLLPLVPLVEIMWADGVLQPAEISIFYECLTRHLAELHTLAAGEEVVSITEAEAFVDHLLKTQPDPKQLEALRQLAVQVLNLSPEASVRQTVLDNCLDLAAVAVSRYPYERRNRIMQAEKAVLNALYRSLHPPA